MISEKVCVPRDPSGAAFTCFIRDLLKHPRAQEQLALHIHTWGDAVLACRCAKCDDLSLLS